MPEHKHDQSAEEKAKRARMEEASRIGVLTREIANHFEDGGKAFMGKTWDKLEEFAEERSKRRIPYPNPNPRSR